MDIGNIKKHSDLNFEVAQAKSNALEKMRSRQLLAYNERLFIADANTINLVGRLKQNNKEDFLSKLIERNQETLNAYHQLHEDLSKKGR